MNIISRNNPLLATDVYKMGHMEQYCPGTNKVYSYLVARSDQKYSETVFFGLQYYLKEYLSIKLTPEMGEEFLKYRSMILGCPNNSEIERKIRALCALGYFPLTIKAVEEGTVMPVRNVLMSIVSSHDDFHWTVGLVESLIIKLWYPISVASCCRQYHNIVDKAFEETVDDEQMFLKDFTVHDFGYRGDATEEGAALSGAAHLIIFNGGDNVPALPFLLHYYYADPNSLIMASVPASEHSVMCSFGRDNEFAAFENMLTLYPTGIVSIVSDTFDVYRVLTEFAARLKDRILARPEGSKVVFRPDSGNPESIICGSIRNVDSIDSAKEEFDKEIREGQTHGERETSAPESIVVFAKDEQKYYKITCDIEWNRHDKQYYFIDDVDYSVTETVPTNEEKGAIRLLDEMFGSTVNKKGYKVLNPKVGLIYGDGMYIDRYQRTLAKMEQMGYAASNLVIGVGGILRNHSRDTMGFAIKATNVEVNGESREIEKDPITDQKKKSHKGLLCLSLDDEMNYVTIDQCTPEQEQTGLLQPVFHNGKLLKETTLKEIKQRLGR